MSSTVEQIKERLGIADVVSSYLKLDKAGGNFKARCPFHNEKTPSFFVSPTRQSYHCFGCDKGGDIFSFVEEIEGLDFSGALKVLADKAGVSIKHENKEAISEKENLFAVMEDATVFFESNLKPAVGIVKYLKSRGLTGETAKKFRLGYATDSWGALHALLKNKGYPDSVMEKAGLIISGDKGYYDRFRNRIMFPILDTSGRVVGFSGRIFGEGNEKAAKYINSPETLLYNKSKILFGFDKAKLSIRKENSCVLVEGQMDLLMSHQVGISNTVAVSGTALSEHHLTMINRLTDNLVIAFDPDDAGVTASKRGVDTALSVGMDVKVVHLPKGVDPADLILKDGNKWKDEIIKATHVIDFYIKVLADKHSDLRIFRVKVGEMVLPYVAMLKDKINQAHFVAEIARKLSISEDPVWEQLRSITGVKKKEESSVNFSPPTTVKKPTRTRRESIERKIIGALFWQEELKTPNIDVDKFKERYKKIINTEKIDVNTDEKEKKKLIFESELYYGNVEKLEESLDELIKYLEEDVLKKEREIIKKELQSAENKDDVNLSTSLLKKYQDISKRISLLI